MTSSRIAALESEIIIDENTAALVKNLRNLGADLKISVDSNNQDLTQNLVNDIKGVWKRIIDKMKPDLYEDLMFYTARLLFLAKYVLFLLPLISCFSAPF